MRRIYYRTVRNNNIKLRGKTLGNHNLQNSELDGIRFCFIPYDDLSDTSGFSFDGLTALWGTEKLNRAKQGTVEEKEAQQENDKILAPDGRYRWYFWRELGSISSLKGEERRTTRMKIETAIERLQFFTDTSVYEIDSSEAYQDRQAVKLGIEALKRIQDLRRKGYAETQIQLPGETN